MNLLSKAYGYILAALAFLATLAGMLFAARKSGKDAVRAEHAEKANEVQAKATDALTTGLQHEQDAIAAARARRADRLRDKSGNR